GRRMEADPGSEDGSRRPGPDREAEDPRVRGRRGPRRARDREERAGAGRTAAVTDGAARALRRVHAGRPLVVWGRGGAGGCLVEGPVPLETMVSQILAACEAIPQK